VLLTGLNDGEQSTPSLAEFIQDLVDPHVGVLRSVTECRAEAGAPNFFHYRATAANTGAFTRMTNFANSAGVSARRDIAASKAIGEAIERYCAAIYEVDELPLISYREATFPCVDPAEFALYSAEQYSTPRFPWVPFTKDTSVRWTEGIDLTTGEECFVPAARVYMPYMYYGDTGDQPIDQPISTGLACHLSRAAAMRAAIGEVAERDAFLIVWQSMMAPPQVRIETLSEANRDLVERFERTDSKVFVFDITFDHGIPTVLSVLLGNQPGAAAMVVAASSSPDSESAVRQSLEELALTRISSQYLKSNAPPIIPDFPHHQNIQDQCAHLHFWTDHANLPLASFLFASNKRIAFDEIRSLSTGNTLADVGIMVERIRSVGERVVVVDLTTPDLADFGLSVVRAVIPGFHPLHIGHSLRALGGTRLWRVPQRLGYPGITSQSGDNPVPHPYP
jgi:ribosomal protein S12 methylthiotransferase accessory factor